MFLNLNINNMKWIFCIPIVVIFAIINILAYLFILLWKLDMEKADSINSKYIDSNIDKTMRFLYSEMY